MKLLINRDTFPLRTVAQYFWVDSVHRTQWIAYIAQYFWVEAIVGFKLCMQAPGFMVELPFCLHTFRSYTLERLKKANESLGIDRQLIHKTT